jgi:hypothetical protein
MQASNNIQTTYQYLKSHTVNLEVLYGYLLRPCSCRHSDLNTNKDSVMTNLPEVGKSYL